MTDSQLLLFTLVLPLCGVGLVCWFGRAGRAAARQSALVTSVLTAAGAAWLMIRFAGASGRGAGQTFGQCSFHWLGAESGLDVQLSVGLDGLSAWMFGLSALLIVTSVLVSWEAIRERATAFYALLLLLEAGMLGVFAARDIVLFYICFEFTLIPLFFLIGVWGSEERRYAAIKFFIYTLSGSLLTFVGLLVIVLWHAQHTPSGTVTFSIQTITEYLAENPIEPTGLQVGIFLALFAGFAIKVPLFPLHTWLPLAHVQAPTAGSVILAGVLLKIGTYGFLRFSIPMLPEATAVCMPYLLWLSVAGIIYGALVALAQSDIKRLIAYSSVSHLGFCMLGLFSLNRLGMQGGALQMINHGLSTGGLFACVGLLYERYHTRRICDLSGLARRTPILAFFMLVFTLSSIGLPGLNGFPGEFLVLVGAFQRGFAGAPSDWAFQYQSIAVLAVLGVVLGAWYMLWLVQRTFFGPLREPSRQGSGSSHEIRDLSLREIAALAPLVVMIVWIGVTPNQFVQPMSSALNQVTVGAETAYEREYELEGDFQPTHFYASQENEASPTGSDGAELVAKVREQEKSDQ